MNIRHKMAIAGASVLGLLGIGGGMALAQSSPSPTVPPAASTPAAAATSAPDTSTAPEAPEAPGTEVADATEAPEVPGSEVEGVEDPAEANLPGGGHADPAGQSVDHQFEGVE
jgi:hypothetical protein